MKTDIRAEGRGGVVWFRPLTLDGWLFLDQAVLGASTDAAFPVPAVDSGPIARSALRAGLRVESIQLPLGA